jgi:hypothetical protein
MIETFMSDSPTTFLGVNLLSRDGLARQVVGCPMKWKRKSFVTVGKNWLDHEMIILH